MIELHNNCSVSLISQWSDKPVQANREKLGMQYSFHDIRLACFIADIGETVPFPLIQNGRYMSLGFPKA